jgi:hypothetical protein
MKKFFKALLLALGLSTIALAQETIVSSNITANSSAILLGKGAIVDSFQFINTSTNLATVTLFDNGSNSTNIVLPQFVSYALGLVTNTTAFTNESGVVINNNTVGIGYTLTTNAASTNSLPPIFVTTIQPSSSLTVSPVPNIAVIRGIVGAANQAVTVVTQYRNQR